MRGKAIKNKITKFISIIILRKEKENLNKILI